MPDSNRSWTHLSRLRRSGRSRWPTYEPSVGAHRERKRLPLQAITTRSDSISAFSELMTAGPARPCCLNWRASLWTCSSKTISNSYSSMVRRPSWIGPQPTGLYGSRFDVRRRFEEGTLEDLKALVLVDMIGDRDLMVLEEAASTPWLKTLIWDRATGLGYGEHFGNTPSAIEDDHIPYLRAGIDAIDLIDFSYPYWHTPGDTVDKTSPDSLKVIGDVLYHALPDIDTHTVP